MNLESMSHRSIELALYMVFGAIYLVAQTAPLGPPPEFDLCVSCSRQDIHLALTPGNRVSQTSTLPRIAEIRANGVPDSRLVSLFILSWAGNHSSLDIAITDTSRLREAGVYELILELVPGVPKLTVTIRVPFAVLQASKLIISRSPFDPPFGLHTFTITERSGKTSVYDLQGVTLQAGLLGADPVSGRIEFDFPPIPAGQAVKASYRLKGRFPLGAVEGSSVLFSPRLEHPIIVDWEVRSSLGFGWLLLYLLFGVTLNWLLTGSVELGGRRRRAQTVAYRQAALRRRGLVSDLSSILASLDSQAKNPETVDSIRGSLRRLLDEIRKDKSGDKTLAAESVLFGGRLSELRTAIVTWQEKMAAVFGRLASVPQLSAVLQQIRPVLNEVTAKSRIETAADIGRLMDTFARELAHARQALVLLASALAEARDGILPRIHPSMLQTLRSQLSGLIELLGNAADDPEAALRRLDSAISEFSSSIADAPGLLITQTDAAVLPSDTRVSIRIEPIPIRLFVDAPDPWAAFRPTVGQAAGALVALGVVFALRAVLTGTPYDSFPILLLIGVASLSFSRGRFQGKRAFEREAVTTRKVDRLNEAFELLISLHAGSDGRAVPIDKVTLEKDTPYQLRFQIPAGNILDRLNRALGGLPQLEVAVQGKDFNVQGEQYQRLTGGKGTLEFTVRTPERDMTAQLRVLIYYDNHLVQSFLFTAGVGGSKASEDPARREFSAVENPTSRSVKQLQPRLISLAINQGASGTHQLFVKGEKAAREVRLNPGTFDPKVTEMRRLLEDAAWADPKIKKAPRLYQPVDVGQATSPQVEKLISRPCQSGQRSLQRTVQSSQQRPQDPPSSSQSAGENRRAAADHTS